MKITAELYLPDSTLWRIAEVAACRGIGFDAALALAVMMSGVDAAMFGGAQ